MDINSWKYVVTEISETLIKISVTKLERNFLTTWGTSFFLIKEVPCVLGTNQGINTVPRNRIFATGKIIILKCSD